MFIQIYNIYIYFIIYFSHFIDLFFTFCFLKLFTNPQHSLVAPCCSPEHILITSCIVGCHRCWLVLCRLSHWWLMSSAAVFLSFTVTAAHFASVWLASLCNILQFSVLLLAPLRTNYVHCRTVSVLVMLWWNELGQNYLIICREVRMFACSYFLFVYRKYSFEGLETPWHLSACPQDSVNGILVRIRSHSEAAFRLLVLLVGLDVSYPVRGIL